MPQSRFTYLYSSIIIVTIIVLCTNLLAGTFFEEYEALIHQFILGKCSYRPYHVWITDMDMCMIPIYAHLQDHFLNISTYSFFKTLFNIIGLSLITYSFISIKNDTKQKILILIFLIFILLDNIININNARISATLSIGIILFVVTRNEIRSKYLIPVLLISVLSSLNRIEIPIIYASLGLFYSLLFRNRKLALIFSIIIILSVSILMLYNKLMYNYNEQIVQFHLYERPLTDRVDFVLQEKVFFSGKIK
jgi:hypothetical protein